jgi:hypothetical protein
MPGDIEKERRGSLTVQPRQPLEGCPDDLRQGIIDYWEGRGMPMEILEKYYSFRKSLAIRPSEAQIRALFSC